MGLNIQLTQHFILSLALGMGLFSLLANTALTGVGLYRVVLGVIGGGLTLSLGIHLMDHPFLSPHSALYLFTLTCVLLLFHFHRDQRDTSMWALYTLKILGIGTLGLLFLESEWPAYFYFLSSALFLGSITFTMVFGHWYLVTPQLTEKPLIQGVELIWCIMALKMTITAWGCWQMEDILSQLPQDTLFNGMMLTMRVAWGYLIIGVLSYFSWKLVRMRSIQSATGIFYVMTFFVFFSELIASFMFYRHGLTV